MPSPTFLLLFLVVMAFISTEEKKPLNSIIIFRAKNSLLQFLCARMLFNQFATFKNKGGSSIMKGGTVGLIANFLEPWLLQMVKV